MIERRYILLTCIVMLFLILASYSIGNYLSDIKYKNAESGLNSDIEELMTMTNDTVIKERLSNINDEVKIINEGCFK
jgi:hypothetical protein